MENRVLVEITNGSEHGFSFDGEWMRAGEWKTDRAARIPPKSLSVVEFQSTQLRGTAGVVWWVDDAEHDVYLSMAFTNPRLQAATFVQYVSNTTGCAWVAAAVGPLTVIKLQIFSSLARYVPPTAASCYGGATSSSSPATQDPEEAPAEPPPPVVPIDCTTLATTGTPAGSAKEDEDATEAIGKFFAQTRPKDALDGLSRGLKTAGTGLVVGVGSIVASTVQGYQEGGLGMVKGLGTGILSGAAIAVGGTACGVAQIGRGIANTPEAVRGRMDQRVWDQELGQWVDIDLCALEHQVELEGSDDDEPAEGGGGAGQADVADPEFYDLLKVKPTATSSDIKKAYYREARQCHPDKNPGDSEAKAKFQKLADAYQVLSDPHMRKKYDKDGKEGVQEGNVKMEPSVFFGLLFGSERFEPWIGELSLAMQTDQFAKSLEKDVDEKSAEESIHLADGASKSLKRRQLHREVHCACHLRQTLDRFVYGRDPEGFEEQVRQEAQSLASGQFGPELLLALGEIYKLRAEIYLADETHGHFSLTKRMVAARHSGITWGHRLNLYQNAAGSLLRVKKVHDAARSSQSQVTEGEEEASEEQQRKVVEEALDDALPIFLQTAWAAVVTDIDGTIKEVGRKLLKDKSVNWQIRVRRSQALQILGHIFAEEGRNAEAVQGDSGLKLITSEAAKATLQEALVGSVREKR
eukprot:CAMPEP_0179239104 /NCGR_PEP_ID=MMETSP0797-20121207/15290_1 /TAXON_ID=47934 /ORGANISM="Dinophysis acuminata, Strain DAEP01" /LENGTH=692 /DNA_ID=CAMNT_0020946419 /DNA_START=67 /DNA_END=2145 /DNA_ORIENTATION=+